MTDFVKVGSLSQFQPGAVHETEVAGRRVLIVNLVGTLHAVSNVCPHVSLPLGGGSLSGDTIACPFHGSVFQLATGECIDGPAAGDSLDVYEVRVDGDAVFVARL